MSSMSPNPPSPTGPLEGMSVQRHALGELVKSLSAIAERECALFDALKVAQETGDKEEVVRLVRDLLSLRMKPENCANPTA